MNGASSGLLVRRIGTLVTCVPGLGSGPLGLIRDAAVLCRGGRIAWVGPDSAVPEPAPGDDPVTLDVAGNVVVPGLVDCHTHIVYAGDRIADFEARLRGETYAEIAARGGGILSTVRATRAASDEELLQLTTLRAEASAAQGVTTIEVKSGYGLDLDQELRILHVIRAASRRSMAELVPTFLGAHSLPEEARSSESARKRYVDLVVDAMLPAVAAQKLAAFCDIFVERGAFTVDEARRVLGKARELGLGLKVHAEQLTCTGAAELAGEYGAASAEHLEYVSEAGLAAMAKAGTVAVLLPGAAWFLRDVPAQSARFRDAGVRMAVASDHNPGTSPTDRLLLMAQMQILSGGMTLDEALLAVTAHAADALSLGHDRGRLKPGYRADLAVFRARDHRELLWRVGGPPCSAVVKDGVYHRVEGARTSTLFGR